MSPRCPHCPAVDRMPMTDADLAELILTLEWAGTILGVAERMNPKPFWGGIQVSEELADTDLFLKCAQRAMAAINRLPVPRQPDMGLVRAGYEAIQHGDLGLAYTTR